MFICAWPKVEDEKKEEEQALRGSRGCEVLVTLFCSALAHEGYTVASRFRLSSAVVLEEQKSWNVVGFTVVWCWTVNSDLWVDSPECLVRRLSHTG